jgi:hypothetical protein
LSSPDATTAITTRELQVAKVFATPNDGNAILHQMAIRIMTAVAER